MQKNNLKILYHFTTNLNGGGAETQMLLLANSIEIKKKFKNIIIYKTSINIDYFKEKYEDIKFIDFDNFKFTENNSIYHIWIPDVFTYLPFYNFKSKNTIIGIRNIYKVKSLKRIYQFINFCFFNKFISNSRFSLQKHPYKFLFYFKNFHYIANGVKYDYKFVKYETKEIDFLFVGRLVKQKGINTILKVLLNNKDLEITFIGKGPLDYNLEELSNQAKLKGHVSDVSSYYEKSKFLILPSYTEGMPNVVLESICFGMIPIISNIPQHTQLFCEEDGVIFFQVGDALSLEKAILKAKKMSICDFENLRNKLIKTIKKYSTSKMADCYLKYYESLS